MRNAYARDMYWAPSAREPEGLSCPSSQPMPVATRPKTLQKKPVPEYSFPGVDERLVVPETSREEMVRGEKIVVMPANPPHAEQQQRLSYVVQSSTKSGYIGATDMLTRTSAQSDFAADTSIRKVGIDPRTGTRYLEELAFEIVDTQTDAQIQTRAEEFVKRGVRRVFAIFVRESRKEVCEWLPRKRSFKALQLNDVIDDQVFIKPISVRAILEAAEADNEVVSALDAKGNPVLGKLKQQAFENGRQEGEEEGLLRGRNEGEAEGRRKAHQAVLLMLLEAKFKTVSPALKERILSADSEQLQAWIAKVLPASSVNAVFD